MKEFLGPARQIRIMCCFNFIETSSQPRDSDRLGRRQTVLKTAQLFLQVFVPYIAQAWRQRNEIITNISLMAE